MCLRAEYILYVQLFPCLMQSDTLSMLFQEHLPM